VVGLTLANPATILSFAAAFSLVGTLGGMVPLGLTAGVAGGSAAWWAVLTTGVALLRRRLGVRPLRALRAASGAVLAAAGLAAALATALPRWPALAAGLPRRAQAPRLFQEAAELLCCDPPQVHVQPGVGPPAAHQPVRLRLQPRDALGVVLGQAEHGAVLGRPEGGEDPALNPEVRVAVMRALLRARQPGCRGADVLVADAGASISRHRGISVPAAGS
jgi:hypothetical protein